MGEKFVRMDCYYRVKLDLEIINNFSIGSKVAVGYEDDIFWLEKPSKTSAIECVIDKCRITIPKRIRAIMDLRQNDILLVDSGEERAMFSIYKKDEDNSCVFCGNTDPIMILFKEKHFCQSCIKAIKQMSI